VSYGDRIGEIRPVPAIEGHKKGKGLAPTQREFRIRPHPTPKKVSFFRTSTSTRNNSGNLNKETVHSHKMLKVKLSRYMPSRLRKEVEVNLYTYSIPALEGGRWSTSYPGRFNPVVTHCIGGWVDLGAGEPYPTGVRNADPPARSKPPTECPNICSLHGAETQNTTFIPQYLCLITDGRLKMDVKSRERLDSLQYDALCSICREFAKPGVTICKKGHYVCSRCTSSSNESCCACDKYPHSPRSPAVETVFKLPVKELSLTAECDCPLSAITGLQCSWSGKLDEIKKHIILKHDKKITDKSGKFSMPFTNFTPQATYSILISTLGEVFMRKAHIRDENFYLVVLYIGPQKNASKYKYSFTISKKNSVENISICQKTRSFLENYDDIYRSRNCVKLHYDVVSDFLLDNSELPNVMEISKV
jgi:hypothetical protein